MSETWQKIFKDFIADIEAIDTLGKDAIIDDVQRDELRIKLLYEIIETMKSEVEE